jgi:hypothetical protein
MGAVLVAIVEDVWVLTVRRGRISLAAVQVRFAGSSHRDYLIMSRAAANHCAGGWWVRSFAEAGAAVDLDLRKPAHAKKLEKLLLSLPLDG